MKSFIKGLIVGILTVVFATGVFAATPVGNKFVQAILAQDTKVKLNGNLVALKDANGKILNPINYDGSIYLPVRAVADLVNLPVNYNSKDKEVLLGTENKKVYIESSQIDLRPSYFMFSRNNLVFNGIEFKSGLINANDKYSFRYDWGNPKIKLGNNASKIGGYLYVSEHLLSEKEYNFIIRNTDNGEVLFTKTLKAGDLIEFEVDAYGARNLDYGVGYGKDYDNQDLVVTGDDHRAGWLEPYYIY